MFGRKREKREKIDCSLSKYRIASPLRKTFAFFECFPMFVPSLSW